jgi:gluconolactonase
VPVANHIPPTPIAGQIRALTPAFDRLIARDARIELLAEGFTWTEGPAWIAEGGYLLFSDVPENRIYRWSEKDGVSLFLEPSGYDGPDPDAFREPGANGLIPGRGNSILLADHGNRAIARLDLATRQKSFLATHYRGKRFNSPNDLARARDGTIYFTDPPYGLAGLDASPLKELPFNGVYRVDPDGAVALIDDSISFPNGIILSPDEQTLYVACSDPDRAIWLAYALDSRGDAGSRRVFADVTASVDPVRHPGLPDGMTIDRAGNLFATGPGGIAVFAPDGTMIGRIGVGTAIANCTFGEDGSTLFIAAHRRLARIRTLTCAARVADTGKGRPPRRGSRPGLRD